MRLSYAARLALCVLSLSAAHCGDDDDTGPGPDGSSDGSDGDGSGDGSGDGADGDADGSGDGAGDGAGDGSGDADPNELPPPTTSGIPTTTQLADLSDGQAQMLCAFERDVYKSYLDSEETYCLALYVRGADTCDADLAQCMEDELYQGALGDDWGCDEYTVEEYANGTSPCTATVSELEACVKADNALYWAHFESASCEDAASLEIPDYAEECYDLYDKCPDL